MQIKKVKITKAEALKLITEAVKEHKDRITRFKLDVVIVNGEPTEVNEISFYLKAKSTRTKKGANNARIHFEVNNDNQDRENVQH